jgi:hypothetical protein
MIRPITCICFLLASGSGLYLYQAKHRVNLLDRQIENTVQATDKLREQTRVLHAEWTLLNDPQRLQTLAGQFLTLKTVQPGQFTSMADLDSRLPPVPPPEPATPPAPMEQPDSPPVAATTQPPEQPPAAPEQVLAAAPQPPLAQKSAPVAQPPVAPAAVAAASLPAPKPPEAKPAERKPAPPPRPVIADARPEQHVVARPVVATTAQRTLLPQRAPYTGSALGMARTASPLPAPTPVSATQWVGNGGGGG